MRSPKTTGLEEPAPGSSLFHLMFSSRLHVSGRPCAPLTPIPLGPRKPGQSVVLLSTNFETATVRVPASGSDADCPEQDGLVKASSGRITLNGIDAVKRNIRINATKAMCGRGSEQAWLISHEELTRYQNEGLLPVPEHY